MATVYKSTIEIYSEFDPKSVELSVLAREAEEGSAICHSQATVVVDRASLPEGVASFFKSEN